jgi:hypothetical protein
MYYVGDFYGTNGIRTAISSDWGLTWTAESIINILPDGGVDPHPVYLTNGNFRLYYRGTFSSVIGIGYADGDGLNFSTSSLTLLFSDNDGNTIGKYDPFVVKYPNGEIACYMGTKYLSGTNDKIIAAWSPTITSTAQAINWIPYRTLDITDGTNFLIDSTGILPSLSDYGVPALNLCSDSAIQIGFANSASSDRSVAISVDSFATWSIYNGSAPANDIDGDFIYLPDGNIRFIVAELYNFKSRIVSYLSSDGYNWMAEAGICYQPDVLEDSLTGVPSVIQLKDSLWRMYYVADMQEAGSGIGNGNGIRTAISTDWGQSWTKEVTSNLLPGANVDPHIMYLSNGAYRLYFRSASLSGIAYVDSQDGLSFDFSKSVLVVKDNLFGTNNLFYDPYVYKLPDDNVYIFMGATGINGNTNSRVVMGIGDSNISSLKNTTQNGTIVLYPNPVTDYLNISLNGAKSPSNTCRIYTIKGDLIFEELISTENIKVDVRNLSWGIYFYEIHNERIPFVKK